MCFCGDFQQFCLVYMQVPRNSAEFRRFEGK